MEGKKKTTKERVFTISKRKVFIALIALVAVVFLCVNLGGKENEDTVYEISYRDMVRMLQNDEVKEVHLTSDSSEVEIVVNNQGHDTEYKSYIPDQSIFLEMVNEKIQNGSDLQITKAYTVSIGNVIFCAFLIIMILSVVIPVFQAVRNLGKSTKILEQQVTSDNKISDIVESLVTFNDVAGLEEEKAELQEVVDFLKNPEKYTSIGAKIPKGVLLSGAPGTGKTLLAKAVAGESGVNFFATSGSEFVEKYVGVGASRIREVFKLARENSPAIIFIDEIDAIGMKRDSSTANTVEHNQTLEQLLIEMDGFSSKVNNVIIIAATNRIETLDPALKRPGRFDRNIIVPLPDVKGREEILKLHSKNKKVADDVDLRSIAYNTAGFSGAELENLMNEAALIAVRKEHQAICKQDVDEAFNKITVGLQKKNRVILEKERKLVAYHEAGHAVVSRFLKNSQKVKEISIIPRGSAGGYTMYKTTEDKQFISKKELEDKMVSLLGGRVAEQLALSDISSGAVNDLERATDIARKMTLVYGMTKEIGPISFKNSEYEEIDINLFGKEISSKAGQLIINKINEAEEQARTILQENKELLEIIAQKLIEAETISGDEFEQCVEAYENTCR